MTRILLATLLTLCVTACALRTPDPGTEADVAALAAGIMHLSDEIDPAEATRAARVTYQTTHRLAVAYEISDPPLIHNAKVNAGLRPRGLCYHWAEDLQARLEQEGFETLYISRAIANADSEILIDHSTAVITPKGAPMQAGMIVDPWRNGGRLFWAPVPEDTRYEWHPRLEVLQKHGRIRYVHRTAGSVAPPPAD